MGFRFQMWVYAFFFSLFPAPSAYAVCEQKDDDTAYHAVADEILSLESRNIVLGENHGYEDSFVLLKNLMLKIGAQGDTAIFLYEIIPSVLPSYISGDTLPVSNDNFWAHLRYYDNRASCINYATTRELIDMPHVSIDSVKPHSFNPSEISGTTWARQFAKVRQDNPNSYIIAIMGTAHAEPDLSHPLSQDDSLCRALRELHGLPVSCIATGTTRFQSERFDRCERIHPAILSTADEHERQVRPNWGTPYEGFDYVVHFGGDACHIWSERYYDPNEHNAVTRADVDLITP